MMNAAPCMMMVLGGWYGPTYNVVLLGEYGPPTDEQQDAISELFGIRAPQFEVPISATLMQPAPLLDANGRTR